MKVLQINCVYKKGSTGKITYDIHTELQKHGIESVVCYGRGEKISEPNVYKTCGEVYSKFNNLLSRFSGVMYGGCYFSTQKLISIIKKENPEIVHLHCLNGYFVNIYRLISWLKKSGIKTVLTLHAEFMYTANCGHAFECEKWKTGCGKCDRFRQETRSLVFDRTRASWRKMEKAFENFEKLTIVSVSPWLKERAIQSPILADKKHCVILNGLDTETFKIYETNELRKRYDLQDEKIIFHATPVFSDEPTHIKGGYFVLELAKRLSDERVKFFVAGEYSKNLKCPKNVVLLGKISDQKELAQYYSMADVTLLTSKKETFSMVTAESLCCGTPVVGFKAGGPEQIAIPEYSSFVEYGNIDELERSIKKVYSNIYDRKIIHSEAKNKYSEKKMNLKYIECYLKDSAEEEDRER